MADANTIRIASKQVRAWTSEGVDFYKALVFPDDTAPSVEVIAGHQSLEMTARIDTVENRP